MSSKNTLNPMKVPEVLYSINYNNGIILLSLLAFLEQLFFNELHALYLHYQASATI